MTLHVLCLHYAPNIFFKFKRDENISRVFFLWVELTGEVAKKFPVVSQFTGNNGTVL